MKNLEHALEELVNTIGDVVTFVRAVKDGYPDIISRRVGNDVIYWPVTELGRKTLKTAFAKGCPRRRFGYAVPVEEDGEVYDILHRTYDSSIGRMGMIGSVPIMILEV